MEDGRKVNCETCNDTGLLLQEQVCTQCVETGVVSACHAWKCSVNEKAHAAVLAAYAEEEVRRQAN